MCELEIVAGLLLFGVGVLPAQSAAPQAVPEIDRNSLSVHIVRRGNMPIRLVPTGEVISLIPPEIVAILPAGTQPSPQESHPAVVLISQAERMMGSIVDIDRATLLDAWKVTIRLKESFPAGVEAGRKVGTLIEIGELKDAVYLEKPGNSHANSEMFLFVIQPDGEAVRTSVRFGRESGALIQVISGLTPGDRVIVTDTTKWNSRERIRIK